MGKQFRSGGIAAPTSGSGVGAGASVESLTLQLHDGLARSGFERAAFARLCRLNAARLLGAVAQRLERDALPCDGHEVVAAAMARLQRHYLRGGAADADSALLASIGGARSWFAAVVALALRVVAARSRWMGAASLPRPGSPPSALTPARLAGRRVRLEAEGLRGWIGGLLLSLPPRDRHHVVQRPRRDRAQAAGARDAADRLFDDVDRIVAAPELALVGEASGEAHDG